MDHRVRRFREIAEEHNAGRPRRAFRYPEEARSLAVGYGLERLERGVSMQEIAGALGVSSPTMGRWLEKVPLSSPGFREVALLDQDGPGSCLPVLAGAASAGSLTLVTPGGYRVEGLSLAEVRVLLEVVG